MRDEGKAALDFQDDQPPVSKGDQFLNWLVLRWSVLDNVNQRNFLLENLVINKEENKDYETYLYQYNITQQELELINQNVSIDLSNKISRITLENSNLHSDIFNKEEHIPLDGDGNPITGKNQTDNMPFGLDIPGFEDDDNFEQLNSQIPTEDESLHEGNDIEDDSL